jgi:hypothetical protein
MAQSNFKVSEPTKIATLDAAKKAAQVKDAANANFHIPAETGAKLTLTGEFFEAVWERGEGKEKRSGTMLMAGVKELSKPISFGFFRTKVLREEDSNKEFRACFSKDAGFEEIVEGIEANKGKQVVVSRGDYIYPGRSSARSIDTLVWAE